MLNRSVRSFLLGVWVGEGADACLLDSDEEGERPWELACDPRRGVLVRSSASGRREVRPLPPLLALETDAGWIADQSTTSRVNRSSRRVTTPRSLRDSLRTRPCSPSLMSIPSSTSSTTAKGPTSSSSSPSFSSPPPFPHFPSEADDRAQVPRRFGTQEAELAVPQAVPNVVPARERAFPDHGRVRARRLVRSLPRLSCFWCIRN